ncbi:hypothetical protein D3C80_1036500 [compost metagenome]
MLCAELRQFGFFHRGGKALDAVIAGMHLHQQPGLFVNRAAVIFQVGAVGRADLDQLATGLAHHVRDAERTANFHQFATRHHHLLAGGDRRQHQQHRSRIVVDDAGVFRAGQLA